MIIANSAASELTPVVEKKNHSLNYNQKHIPVILSNLSLCSKPTGFCTMERLNNIFPAVLDASVSQGSPIYTPGGDREFES